MRQDAERQDTGQAVALYEVALAIGGSLDLTAMLRRALDAFVRRFGCSSGAIYLASAGVLSAEPAAAIPDERNAAVQAVEALPAVHGAWPVLYATLPQTVVARAQEVVCLLPVGRQGVLALAGQSAILRADQAHVLLPLAARLDEAVHACHEHMRVADAHRAAQLEGSVLRTVFESTPTALIVIDSAGRCILSEGRGLKAAGIIPEKLVGRSMCEVLQGAPVLLDAVAGALAGQPSQLTIQFNNRNWDVSCEPLLDEAGEVTCVVGVARDVTARTLAIDSLSAVLQTVGEGILSLDADGRILLVNAELERTFGYSADELLGQPIGLLLPAFALLSTPAGGELPWCENLGQRRELQGQRKSGDLFPVEVCINELMYGAEVQYTGSLRDITERKEYDRLRDEFVSTVSHELRTPLASIMGWTETLLTEHPGPINAGQRRFLNIVYASSQRLNRLIEEILTVSRIQRGTLRIHAETFQPPHLLAAVLESAAPAAERQGIHLDYTDLWPPEQHIMGDPHLLEQVVNNLIANAVKFSSAGAAVTVRSLPVQDGWRVEVQDHGVGIAAADLPKLFQRFVRGSNAKAAHTQGVGLGLFVSKAIVEGHGGQIYLTSREGEGTTVWFDLPPRLSEPGFVGF